MDKQGFPIKIQHNNRCKLFESSDYKEFVTTLNSDYQQKKRADAERLSLQKKENKTKLQQGEQVTWSKEEIRALKVPYHALMDRILSEFFSFIMEQ